MEIQFSNTSKNNHFLYYINGFFNLLTPSFVLRIKEKKLQKYYESLTKNEKQYILDRVDYYCKKQGPFSFPKNSPTLAQHTYRKKTFPSVYFFDTQEYTRYFPKTLKWHLQGGDVTQLFDYPTIVKSRPIGENNGNSVLMKLNKVRHFFFVKDSIPFEQKQHKIIFRGAIINKSNRKNFIKLYGNHPLCDAKDTSKNSSLPENLRTTQIMSISDHFKFRYIMCLEGNDVASNLKWVMSSNSLAVMPKPKYETWYMEGRLIPNYHYIEIKEDYSDLIDKINYYSTHQEEAQAIIQHANEYTLQFKNKKREDLISYLVLKKYFGT
jgi:hypothetical protein